MKVMVVPSPGAPPVAVYGEAWVSEIDFSLPIGAPKPVKQANKATVKLDKSGKAVIGTVA